MDRQQMEMSFEMMCGYRPLSRRERRLSRANWWFERMRQVVDRAFDWEPAPPPRPEQIWFANAHRQPAPSPAQSEVRQICE